VKVLGAVLPFWLERPPREALDVASAAGQHGFTELWMGELFHFDAFGLASYLAASTDLTICVGPLAAGVRDPVLLARGIATVSVLGNRPARLALGASNPQIVSAFHGRGWGDAPSRLEETILAIRQILGGDRTDFEGMHVQSTGYRSALGPQPLHLTVAAFGPLMVRVAARNADRAVLNLVTVEQVASIRDALDRARDGRTDSVPLAVWVAAAIDPTAEAVNQIRRQVALYVRARGYREMFIAAGFSELVERSQEGMPLGQLVSSIPDELLEGVALIGSRLVVAERIRSYSEFADELAIVPATEGDPGGQRTLGAIRAIAST